jgi:hypothetical protein
MWEALATNAGAVLGLAISIYTIYSFAEARALRKRRQYAFLRHLHEQLSYFVALSRSLSHRAQQVMDLYSEHYQNRSFPNPGAEPDELPNTAEANTRWLVERAEHLLAYPVLLDVEKLGEMLNRRQIDTLLEMENQRRIYLQALTTRTMDLRAFPRRRGVLARFAGVAHLNIGPLDQSLASFAESLGLRSNRLASGEQAAA